MEKKKIILAGSSKALSEILAKMEHYSSLEVIALLSDTKDGLEERYQKFYSPLDSYPKLSVQTLEPDWLLHIDSETIFSPDFLEHFKGGALSAHPGILPDYAGAFPFQWAIRNDEFETGATLHWITTDADTGPIALQETFKISDEDTGYTIYSKSQFLCINLIEKALKSLNRGEKLPIIPQDKFKRKVYTKADAIHSEVDWSLSARKVFNFIRAANFTPLPSPSYTAKTHLKKEAFSMQKVRLGERALGIPGMVSSLKDGTHVVCGDGVTVVLSPDTPTPPLKVGDILG